MLFPNPLTLLTLLPLIAPTAWAHPEGSRRAVCTAKYRIDELNGVAPAFSDMTPGATAKYLQQLPLKPDAQLLLYPNGLGPITVARDASTVRNFALGVRQIFYKVTPTMKPKSVDYGNGTTHTELEIVSLTLVIAFRDVELMDVLQVLGPRAIALPVNIHAGMNFNWDLNDCQLETLQGFLTIPSQVGGQPVDPTAIMDQIIAAGNSGQVVPSKE